MSESEATGIHRLESRDAVLKSAQQAIRHLPEHQRAALRYEFDRAEAEGRRIASSRAGFRLPGED